MFKKGNFVVNANHGICEISDIVTMDMSGINKEYYVLIPIEEKNAKIYIPVDVAEKRIRPAMNKEDALKLIKEINDLEIVLVAGPKYNDLAVDDWVATDPYYSAQWGLNDLLTANKRI